MQVSQTIETSLWHLPRCCQLKHPSKTSRRQLRMFGGGRSSLSRRHTFEYLASRAQRRPQEDENDVRLDDEYESGVLDFLPATSGKILSNLQGLTDRFVDIVFDLVPTGTSRTAVETSVKGGMLLVTIAFASSMLSFLLNAGFVLLALYVAAKVFGVNVGPFNNTTSAPQGSSQRQSSKGNQSKSWQSPKQRNRGKSLKPNLGQAAGDLTDVWFERQGKTKVKD